MSARVSSGSEHREKSSKYDAHRSILKEIRGIWIAHEKLSRVFDISYRSNKQLRKNVKEEVE